MSNRKATFAKRQRESDLKDHAKAKNQRREERRGSVNKDTKGPEIAWDQAVNITVAPYYDALVPDPPAEPAAEPGPAGSVTPAGAPGAPGAAPGGPTAGAAPAPSAGQSGAAAGKPAAGAKSGRPPAGPGPSAPPPPSAAPAQPRKPN